jgi:hypothetical protein
MRIVVSSFFSDSFHWVCIKNKEEELVIQGYFLVVMDIFVTFIDRLLIKQICSFVPNFKYYEK